MIGLIPKIRTPCIEEHGRNLREIELLWEDWTNSGRQVVCYAPHGPGFGWAFGGQGWAH